MPAILPRPTVDYSDKDFEALKLRLQGLIRSVFPDWTDFAVANFGNILLELFCWVGDMLSFYQDNQAREAFWPTVRQRISAIRLGRLINFQLAGAAASTGSERFSTIGGPTANNIPIPLGTRLRSKDPVRPLRYRTTAAGVLLAGSSTADVAIEQATLVTGESFVSLNAPDQEYVTQQSPYLDDSALVTALDGTYLEVDSFLDDDPLAPGTPIGATSRIFVVLVDQFDKAHLRFGNGTLGKIPQGTVSITYKTGGGSDGNVEAGLVGVLEDQLYDALSNPVSLTVSNPLATSGGTDRMSVAEARSLAPASLRALNRSVTKDDFEVHARQVPGVSRAVMATSNEDVTIAENTGRVQIVARGEKLASGRTAPAAASSSLVAAVLTQVTVTYPPPLTFAASVDAAPFKTINVSTRVYLEQGTDPTIVGAAIRAALADFFASELEDGSPNPKIDFGANLKDETGATIGEIAWSNVFNAINDTSGVRKIDEGSAGLLLNGLRLSVTLQARQFPVLGTVTIVDASTGSAI